MQKIFKTLCLSISLMFTHSIAFAEVVTQHIPELKLTAEAEYSKGMPNKPAVLMLHGFLTTNQFHTVRSMAQAYNEAGYTTLAPTLTLNISQRKQSVKCNAIHTHTLENDVLEVKHWIQWLKDQGVQEIVLLGHSSGSPELMHFLAHNEEPTIKLAIFTSLFFLSGPELGTLQSEIDHARNALKNNNMQPHKYSFLFCKNNYFATPESFLSYQKLDRAYLLDNLKNLKVPSYTIMGGEDKRYQSVGHKWLDELEQTGTHLIVVEGANHFFSSEYEFDLQDQLIKITDAQFE